MKSELSPRWKTISVLIVLGSMMLLVASWSLPEDGAQPWKS
jgi:hypothetical protein